MKKSETTTTPETMEKQPMSQNHWAVSKFLGGLKFRKRLFGVDEADVWRKMEKLCELYEYALEAERVRADAAQQKLDQIYAKARAIQATRKAEPEDPTRGGQL